MESESQKKSYCVLGDVYGVVMLPKELDHLDKHHSFDLPRLQFPDLAKPFQDILRTREVGEFLSGALAGAMTKAVLAPLETIRTRMVVGIGSKSIAGSFAEVIEHQGLQGLWAGNTVNMLRIVPTQAIEFGTFEYVKRAMTSAQERWNQTDCPMVQIGHVNLKFSLSWISPIAVAGAAAGVVSTLVCHPLEVLKDRLTISPEAYPSIAVAVSRIYKDGGLGAFYAGLAPTLIGILPYSTCYYFMYEKLKKSYCLAFKKKSLSRADMLLVGALSGFTAGTISFPLEVARKRLMVGALEGKCPPNMAAALAEVIRERGLLGLYRGWGASCLKVAPSSGITWMFYEAWKDILLLERRRL
ncbi:probable mitochondrial adenine nucleotide transporter BTL1 [Rhododendron vialii]|uniref:probable mitochondrial adenine nucleotide transporter BTL1 n=1 Tax=Rhododendron vialii TaxID=182163 RepID=UPI00265E7BE3|nr:probable mitochondrial adenine nucleotide transporter BTL1 [Rhododendron vialii]